MWDTEKGQCGSAEEKPLGLLHVKAGVGVGVQVCAASRVIRSASGLPSPTKTPSHHHLNLQLLLSFLLGSQTTELGSMPAHHHQQIIPGNPDKTWEKGIHLVTTTL